MAEVGRRPRVGTMEVGRRGWAWLGEVEEGGHGRGA